MVNPEGISDTNQGRRLIGGPPRIQQAFDPGRMPPIAISAWKRHSKAEKSLIIVKCRGY
jgi:hypothetical protein